MASYTSSSQTTLLIIFLIFTISSSFAKPPISTSGRFTKIYAFGDSYTDTGNTHSATGPNSFIHVSQLPYGMTFFHRPTNRYSDGRLVIDFVAEFLSLPYLPPYLNRKADTTHGVNFAVAGSTAIEHAFFVKNNLSLDITPQSIKSQLLWFNEYLKSKGCGEKISVKCRGEFEDSLFWVGEIGANDYAYSVASSVSTSTIQDLSIQSVTTFLQALLLKGAKYIVVQGLPTTGCLPLSMILSPADDRDDIGCVASVNKQSFTHNSILQSKLHDLRTKFPHAVILYADYWNAYHTIMKNSSQYGIKEQFKNCCGSGGEPYNLDLSATCGSPSAIKACPDPSRYINWDGVHLTEAMYKVVADLFLRRGYCRPSFDFLMNSKGRA